MASGYRGDPAFQGRRGPSKLRPGRNGREVQILDKIQELMLAGFPDRAIEAAIKTFDPQIDHLRFLALKRRARPDYESAKAEQVARIQMKLLAAADEMVDRCIEAARTAKSEGLRYKNVWDILDRAGLGAKSAAPVVTVSAQQNYLSVNLVRGDPGLIEAIERAQIAKDNRGTPEDHSDDSV